MFSSKKQLLWSKVFVNTTDYNTFLLSKKEDHSEKYDYDLNLFRDCMFDILTAVETLLRLNNISNKDILKLKEVIKDIFVEKKDEAQKAILTKYKLNILLDTFPSFSNFLTKQLKNLELVIGTELLKNSYSGLKQATAISLASAINSLQELKGFLQSKILSMEHSFEIGHSPSSSEYSSEADSSISEETETNYTGSPERDDLSCLSEKRRTSISSNHSTTFSPSQSVRKALFADSASPRALKGSR